VLRVGNQVISKYMKILVLTCSDPTKVGHIQGHCPYNKRSWQELEIPDITFWESLITTFSSEHFAMIVLGSMTALATGFGVGLIVNMVRRGRNII